MNVASKAALSFAVLVKAKSRSRGDDVDFVEDEKLPRLHLGQPFEDGVGFLVEPFARVDQHAGKIGLMRAAPGAGHHGAIEPPARRKNSRRVDKDQLRDPAHRDAADQRARGLNFARDDRDFRADQCVEQSRLAGIGRADQRDKAAARSRLRAKCQASSLSAATPTRSSMAAAADCSAARLDEPTPSAGGRSGSTTATRNLGLWCGPVRANSR